MEEEFHLILLRYVVLITDTTFLISYGILIPTVPTPGNLFDSTWCHLLFLYYSVTFVTWGSTIHSHYLFLICYSFTNWLPDLKEEREELGRKGHYWKEGPIWSCLLCSGGGIHSDLPCLTYLCHLPACSQEGRKEGIPSPPCCWYSVLPTFVLPDGVHDCYCLPVWEEIRCSLATTCSVLPSPTTPPLPAIYPCRSHVGYLPAPLRILHLIPHYLLPSYPLQVISYYIHVFSVPWRREAACPPLPLLCYYASFYTSCRCILLGGVGGGLLPAMFSSAGTAVASGAGYVAIYCCLPYNSPYTRFLLPTQPFVAIYLPYYNSFCHRRIIFCHCNLHLCLPSLPGRRILLEEEDLPALSGVVMEWWWSAWVIHTHLCLTTCLPCLMKLFHFSLPATFPTTTCIRYTLLPCLYSCYITTRYACLPACCSVTWRIPCLYLPAFPTYNLFYPFLFPRYPLHLFGYSCRGSATLFHSPASVPHTTTLLVQIYHYGWWWVIGGRKCHSLLPMPFCWKNFYTGTPVYLHSTFVDCCYSTSAFVLYIHFYDLHSYLDLWRRFSHLFFCYSLTSHPYTFTYSLYVHFTSLGRWVQLPTAYIVLLLFPVTYQWVLHMGVPF